ncbi:MAG: deoxyribose-phosphate aldolase [Lachnospiraceae bacterium]|nr:deoxyribose-phosphate aldolase [Lachnospiraceae bacterium]
MDDKVILSHIDYTLLKPTATWDQIKDLCDKAVASKTASVCVPAGYVARIHEEYGDQLNICTVIGFPLGYSTADTKAFEAKEAIKDGAHEIDTVINVCDVKNGDFDKVLEELILLRSVTSGHVLKVIIETCYLTEEEKVKMCGIVTKSGADYIKTSTGFGTNGATLDDVKLFKANIGPRVKIKAAGGIRTREDMESYIEAGADRIGASTVPFI